MAAVSIRTIVIAAAFACVATIVAAEAALDDFLIFGVKPADDANAASLVEIGGKDIDPPKLSALIATLPVNFWGNVTAATDTDTGMTLCSSACASRALCRSITYDAPTKDRPVGVCRLKTDTAQTFGKMAPVDDSTEVKPETPLATADIIPAPPVLTITVEPMALPPRVVAAAPPTSILPQPKAAAPKVVAAKPPAVKRQRYLPVWVIFAMLAFVIGGALLYRRNYFARQRKAGLPPVPSAPIAHDLAA